MKKLLLTSLVLAIGFSTNASAATTTKNFQSSSTLAARCVMEIGSINFGNLDYFQPVSNYTSGTELKILCSKGVSYTIEPLGGYLDGYNYILKGQAGNTDGVIVGLNKLNGGVRTAWSRTSNANKIISTGTGTQQTFELGGASNRNGMPSSLDAAYTNAYNYEARPGTYSLTVTAQVTY